MGGLSSIEHAFHKATHQVENAVHSVTHALDSTAGTVLFPEFNPKIQAAAGAAGLLYLLGGSGGAGAAGASGLGSLLGGSSGASGIAAIISEVGTFIKNISGELDTIIKPIAGTIHETTSLINQVNDTVIKPVQNIVEGTQQSVDSLINAFHTDLQGGLKGLVKLPGDISHALTGLDATYQRSTQELAGAQSDIVTTQLVPGLNTGIGEPLGGIHEVLKSPQDNAELAAAFTDTVKLNEDITGDELLKQALAFEAKLENVTGFFSGILHFAWGLLKFGDAITAQIGRQIDEIRQRANMQTPVSLLGEGQVIEALRRGLLSDKDAATELLKQGLDPTRQQVLYDLAQFMFGPQDAVRLLYRNIIGGEEYATLIDQNNLDPDQAAALEQLMMHILGPGDIAAAAARGIVSTDVAAQMTRAAMVDPLLYDVIQELELDLIDPKKLLHAQGRLAANASEFLGGGLGGEPPKAVTSQYDKAQAEPGSAALDWLLHWHMPGPGYWMQTYFRGIRTWSEVEQAFTALNIPPEIWDDIRQVEEELPPVWMVPDIVASGVWGKDKAVAALMKLGFSEENATLLFQYGFSKGKTAKASTAADLQKVSLSNAASLYDDGIINVEQYTQILLDHGYSTDAANLTVELAQFKLATTERNNAAQDLVNQATLGEINTTQFQQQLYTYGFTESEVNKWLLKLKSVKAQNAKLPSEAQLDKLLKGGFITEADWLATMVAIGYSEQWAQLLLEIV